MRILSGMVGLMLFVATLLPMSKYQVINEYEPVEFVETVYVNEGVGQAPEHPVNDEIVEDAEPSDAAGEEIVENVTEVIDDEFTKEDDKVVYDYVPLMDQKAYPNDWYGWYGTISTHGCGIVSLAMVATYLTDEWHDPVDLAKQYADYNTEHGSKWNLFEDSAEIMGFSIVEKTYDFKKVRAALEDGHVVIALYHEDSYFTDGGHFVVLTGINENNKVTVNDPYSGNYNANIYLIEGFANGFDDHYVTCGGGPFWIYAKKGEHPFNYQEIDGADTGTGSLSTTTN